MEQNKALPSSFHLQQLKFIAIQILEYLKYIYENNS